MGGGGGGGEKGQSSNKWRGCGGGLINKIRGRTAVTILDGLAAGERAATSARDKTKGGKSCGVDKESIPVNGMYKGVWDPSVQGVERRLHILVGQSAGFKKKKQKLSLTREQGV